ncbi:hypothetical protein [Streptomyces sp. NPDC057702]|uniref:hypothetical protein n=1 Tax=unclassified Streptomyces TaxID=2593676 RepID=UPI0036CFBE6A
MTACDAQPSASGDATPRLRGAALARVQGSEAEQRRLFDAEERLTADCMTDRGFTYRPNPWHGPSATPADDPRHGDDVRTRRRAGYGSASATGADGGDTGGDPNGVYVRSLARDRQRAYMSTLYGTAQHKVSAAVPGGGVTFMYGDGCNGGAQRRLYGDLRRWMVARLVVANLDSEINRRLLADRRVTRADAAWSRCMNDAGHSFPHPAKARAVALGGEKADERRRPARPAGKAAGPSRREIAIAVADAQCDRSVGRAKLIRSLDGHYRDQLARERAESINTYRELRGRALASLAASPERERHAA